MRSARVSVGAALAQQARRRLALPAVSSAMATTACGVRWSSSAETAAATGGAVAKASAAPSKLTSSRGLGSAPDYTELPVADVPPADMTSARAVRMMNRELMDEHLKTERPPEPRLPRGWQVEHLLGTGEFWVTRLYENELGTLEELRARCGVEIKDYEKTYRQDDGEREEPEHINFTLFVSKPKKGPEVGGLEFMLTSVDSELVLDSVAVHANRADFVIAQTREYKCEVDRDLRYRGPYINELDEDFADEIMNYLDDRGVHNTFAEFVAEQAHVIEQIEYEHFLKVIRAYASSRRAGKPSAPASSGSSGSTAAPAETTAEKQASS